MFEHFEGQAGPLDGSRIHEISRRISEISSPSHRIFTPTDLTATELIEDDLPYSALLYGSAVLGSQSRDSLNAVSLSVGVTGPLALGEEVQSTIHEVIGSEEPLGWDNQIENELLVNFGFDSRRRFSRFGERDGFGGDESATVPWDHPDGLDRESYGRIGLSWDL